MPVFNTEAYLDESIQSILNQSYKNFEFIIIDDGSSDNSKNIIKFYQKKDNRIVFIENKKNIWPAKSFIKGFNIAKGSFIARMDSDDISHKDRFKKQIQLFSTWPELSVLGTGANIIDSTGKLISRRLMPFKYSEISKILKYSVPVFNPSVMVRKSTFELNGLLDPNFDPADDLELWLRFFSKKAIISNVQEYLISYRIHSSNVSTIKYGAQIANSFLAFNLYNPSIKNKKKIILIEKKIVNYAKNKTFINLCKIFEHKASRNKLYINKIILSFILNFFKEKESFLILLNLLSRYFFWRLQFLLK
jgi:glycosyltransferase involved in cell wall biosynthesis